MNRSRSSALPARWPRGEVAWLQALALGVLVTAAAVWLENGALLREGSRVLPSGWGLGRAVAGDTALLLFGVLLALADWRRSGLRIGSIRTHAWQVLLVCSVPVLATALVYPQLPERPFSGAGYEMWLLSPFAQDILFAGFLYGRLNALLPGRVHPRLPCDRALIAAALCFSCWHLPNFGSSMSDGYVIFQLAYTGIGFILTGLTRQWTGSFLYMTLSHMAVNWIAAR